MFKIFIVSYLSLNICQHLAFTEIFQFKLISRAARKIFDKKILGILPILCTLRPKLSEWLADKYYMIQKYDKKLFAVVAMISLQYRQFLTPENVYIAFKATNCMERIILDKVALSTINDKKKAEIYISVILVNHNTPLSEYCYELLRSLEDYKILEDFLRPVHPPKLNKKMLRFVMFAIFKYGNYQHAVKCFESESNMMNIFMKYALRHSNAEVVKHIHKSVKDHRLCERSYAKWVQCAIEADNLKKYKFIISLACAPKNHISDPVVTFSPNNRRANIPLYLIGQGYAVDKNSFLVGGSYIGNETIINLMIKRGATNFEEALIVATRSHSRVSIIKLLAPRCSSKGIANAIEFSIETLTIKALNFLISIPPYLRPLTIDAALTICALRGTKKQIEIFQQHGGKFIEIYKPLAAENGRESLISTFQIEQNTSY